MDENSCENETEESVDDKEKKKAKTDPQEQDFTAKLSLTGRPTRSQVSNRLESSVDAQGPSTNFYPLILKQSGAIQAIFDGTDSEEPVGAGDLEVGETEPNVQQMTASVAESEHEVQESTTQVQESTAQVQEIEQKVQRLAKLVEKTEKKVQQLAGPVEETRLKVQQSSQTPQDNGVITLAPAPVSIPLQIPVQENVGLSRETGTLIPSTHNLREAHIQTVPVATEEVSVKSVGPPPSYSFVMKQKKKLKPMPSPDSMLSNRSPPPNYAGARGLYITSQERTFGFPSFAEPIWRSHSQPALCPRCGIIVLTTAHAHESIATHVAALALCLFGCWPCCLLPYCMNVCKNTYHYCPICQAFLGLYTPW